MKSSIILPKYIQDKCDLLDNLLNKYSIIDVFEHDKNRAMWSIKKSNSGERAAFRNRHYNLTAEIKLKERIINEYESRHNIPITLFGAKLIF